MRIKGIGNLGKDLSSLWNDAAGVRGWILAISLLGSLSVALSLLFIWITKSIVDTAVSPGHAIPFGLISALIACLAAQLLVPALRRRIEVVAATRYSNNMRKKLLGHLLQAKWTGQRNMHTGDAINRMQKDVDTLTGIVDSVSGDAVVYHDGINERKIGAGLRRNIIYVPQGNTLLKGSVRYNLLLGNPEATEDMMTKALRIAAAEFAMDLPAGLDSDCFEGGLGFCEGQAQRIALARGLLKEGNIILLDEPTSALDTTTEKELMTRLTSCIPKSSTVIIVTHRRELLDFCTDILDLTARQGI